ncbi:MAG: hypothetical protein JRN61_02010 [Nitrososphaerota archaeon]|nr:hypothetical protein [Nitrososphaerota archaeon]
MAATLITEGLFLLLGITAGAPIGVFYLWYKMGDAARNVWKVYRKKTGLVISVGDDMLGRFVPGVRTPRGVWQAGNNQVFFPDKQSVYRINGLPAIFGYSETAYTPGSQLLRHIDIVRKLLGKKFGGRPIDEAVKQYAIGDEEKQVMIAFFKNLASLQQENIEDYLIYLTRVANNDPDIKADLGYNDEKWKKMLGVAKSLVNDGLKPEIIAADGKTTLKYETPLGVQQWPDGSWHLAANWTLTISGYHQYLPKNSNPGDVEEIINEEIAGRIAEMKHDWMNEFVPILKWVLLILAVGITGYILIDAVKGNIQLPKVGIYLLRMALGI